MSESGGEKKERNYYSRTHYNAVVRWMMFSFHTRRLSFGRPSANLSTLSRLLSAFCSFTSFLSSPGCCWWDISEITHRSDGFGRQHAHCHLSYDGRALVAGKWAILIAFNAICERGQHDTHHSRHRQTSLNSNSEKFQFPWSRDSLTIIYTRTLCVSVLVMMKQYFH